MLKKIYNIIMPHDNGCRSSRLYDILMIGAIAVSMIPMFFKETNILFFFMDKVTVTIFIVDYVLRWITAKYLYETNNNWIYLKYPFTFMALVDLLSILPSLTIVNSGFRIFKLLRITRSMKVIRIFKSLRYSKNFTIIIEVIKSTRSSLSAVAILCVMYIMASALLIFNIEPDTFNNYFDAIYWATVSLTTVGYGDIYPISTAGRIVTMLSSIFGIAIIALPAGIITAGFMREIEKLDNGNE